MLSLKILAVWFLISIPVGIVVGKFLKSVSQKCLACGGRRRSAIQTEGYEYFECEECGAREALRCDSGQTEQNPASSQPPLNQRWLNGKEWC